MRRFPWQLMLIVAAGMALGVLYSWVLAPVRYVDTTPDTLRTDFKDQFRSSIAASYAASGNIERARTRLALLGDPNTIEALNAQAQRMLATGDSFENIQQVAQLAVDLQVQSEIVVSTTVRPTLPQTRPPTQRSPQTGGSVETPTPQQSFDTPAAASSPTPRPTRTATPVPSRPFVLAGQDTLCDADLQEGLLQVIVIDARRRQVPGAEIVVTWDGGEEHFFTGFKPELGNGYADFVMQAGITYNVRVQEGGAPVSGVTPPSCSASEGDSFTGSIQLTFRQE